MRTVTADTSEKSHDDVYGRTFALYDREQLLAFMQPFVDRFVANQLDARAVFTGKRCLDAGCGGGRGTLFLLQNGAAHVTSFDFSARNVETTRRNAAQFGFTNVSVQQGTLEKLPFADGTFDVVWCNGVLQHAADPDRCLTEITRVLAPGGRAWIYVYGAGGVYWYAVRHFRRWFRDMSSERLIATLQLAGLEPRYVAEYLDDWKVSFLRAYRRSPGSASSATKAPRRCRSASPTTPTIATRSGRPRSRGSARATSGSSSPRAPRAVGPRPSAATTASTTMRSPPRSTPRSAPRSTHSASWSPVTR